MQLRGLGHRIFSRETEVIVNAVLSKESTLNHAIQNILKHTAMLISTRLT